jgi:hypothetical protein
MHDDFGDYAITNMTQQRHHQHDSTATSRHGQRHLGNAIACMTRRHYRQHDSASTSCNDLIIINNI